MANVTCPTCAREVDETLDACPHCGARLDGIGVGGPRPTRDAPPEAADRAADYRVGGPETTAGVPRDAGEGTPDVEGPARTGEAAEPVAAADPDDPAARAPTDADARPGERPAGGGLAWGAVLGGFLAFLVGGLVFQLFLAPWAALVATVALGGIVAFRMAPQRKVLHATVAFLLYYLVSFALGLLATFTATNGSAPPP